ncbi:lipopolysaccharide biosynthesis protein [Roseomonas elaeocarpi]|uniref:Lipopolysaccharide biosynthesis protein n=1 Tax=Roseomonas elaeocarpi TaxID=907779 RepID=A0ABV6JVY6_9PROT
MKRWFQDGLLRSVLRNAGYLLSGKLAGAVLGLVALSCAGRGLTPALFGTLMIVHTYANGAGALVKFQTWQFIIRFGAPALARGERDAARDTIRFAFGLDIASGLLGMVAAMAILPFLANWLELPPEDFRLALFYCTLVPTMTAATPVGVLRLLDRFDLIGWQQTVTPTLRAAVAAAAFFAGWGFPGFVAAWYLADLSGDLVTWFLAARELRRHDLADAFRPGLFATARRLPGAWGFVWTTNLAHSVYGAWGSVSNLVVAGVLGPVAAGLFKISTTLLDSSAKPADMLSRGFYPEIMRLDPSSRQPWRLGLRVSLLSAAMGAALAVVVQLAGAPVIGFVFGQKYLAAFGLLQVMTWSLVISTAAFPLESLLYMADRQRAALAAQLVATALYLALLFVLTHRFGLAGAGYAFLLGTVLNAGLMLLPTLGSYRRRASLHRHAEAAA